MRRRTPAVSFVPHRRVWALLWIVHAGQRIRNGISGRDLNDTGRHGRPTQSPGERRGRWRTVLVAFLESK